MPMKLSDLFEAARASWIEWEGRVVHGMYEVAELPDSAVLTINLVEVSPSRPQALRLRSRGGKLEVNGRLEKDMVIWSDTAPEATVAVAHPSRSGQSVSLQVWNAWRDRTGTMQAWVGNAGMLVEGDLKSGLVLRCSDGTGDATFDDLVATLTLEAAPAPGGGDG